MSVYSEKSPLVGNQNNNPFVKSDNNDRDLVDNGQDSMKFEQKNPRKRTLRNNVYRIMEGGWKPYDHIAAWFILFCILVNLTAFILRTEDNYDKDYGTLFNFMEIFTTIVFTIEFPLRVWVCVENDRYGSKGPVKGRLKYSVRFLSLLDICSFVPFWIFLSVGWYDDESIVPITVSILRIFRLFKTERYTHTMKIVKAIVQQNREILFTYFNIVLVAFLGCSTMLYYTEKQQNPDKYKSIPDAMYNTLTFLVTQGVPTGEISTGGKWVISVGECIALVIVAIPAGLFGYGFQLFGQKLHRKRRKEQKRRSLKSLNASHDDDEAGKEINLFRDTDSDEPTLKEGGLCPHCRRPY